MLTLRRPVLTNGDGKRTAAGRKRETGETGALAPLSLGAHRYRDLIGDGSV
jgi:hypothetical protein